MTVSAFELSDLVLIRMVEQFYGQKGTAELGYGLELEVEAMRRAAQALLDAIEDRGA